MAQAQQPHPLDRLVNRQIMNGQLMEQDDNIMAISPEEILLTGLAPTTRAIDNWAARRAAMQDRAADRRSSAEQAMVILGLQQQQAKALREGDYAHALALQEARAKSDAENVLTGFRNAQTLQETDKKARLRELLSQRGIAVRGDEPSEELQAIFDGVNKTGANYLGALDSEIEKHKSEKAKLEQDEAARKMQAAQTLAAARLRTERVDLQKIADKYVKEKGLQGKELIAAMRIGHPKEAEEIIQKLAEFQQEILSTEEIQKTTPPEYYKSLMNLDRAIEQQEMQKARYIQDNPGALQAYRPKVREFQTGPTAADRYQQMEAAAAAKANAGKVQSSATSSSLPPQAVLNYMDPRFRQPEAFSTVQRFVPNIASIPAELQVPTAINAINLQRDQAQRTLTDIGTGTGDAVVIRPSIPNPVPHMVMGGFGGIMPQAPRINYAPAGMANLDTTYRDALQKKADAERILAILTGAGPAQPAPVPLPDYFSSLPPELRY